MSHTHHHLPKSISALRLVFFLNLSFTVIEIVGGYLTNSMAIMADAVHDLGDSLALGIAWGFEVIARKNDTDQQSYGFGRVSLLAALINSVILTAGATIVITRALPRFTNPETSHATGMMGLALLGLAVNGYAAWRTARGKSMNERVVSLHLFEDVLGWAAVLIGAIILKFTGWSWIDPLLAVMIAVFVMVNVTGKLWQIGRIFLQLSPGDVDVDDLKSRIADVPGVVDVHHFHVWSLDGEHHVLTIHVRIDSSSPRPQIKAAIREVISEGDFLHITIELDEDENDCSMPP